MSKRLVFWFRVALVIAILMSPVLMAMAFFEVQYKILQFPDELRYPNQWGTVAALCVLLLPIGLAEMFALSLAKRASQIKVIYKVLEVTCWFGAICAFVLPVVFSVTQDVGHITIVALQLTASSILAAGALLARMCQQSTDRVPFSR